MVLPVLTAGLGLMLAGRVTAQNFAAWPVTQVAAGGEYSLFTRSDGTLFVMGDNTYGQLGLGPTVSNVNIPTALTNGVGTIAAGYAHTLLIRGRTLWAMGNNSNGQLGDGTTNNHYVPEQIGSLSISSESYYNALAAGGAHSLFGINSQVVNGGGLYAMGYNGLGQLGDGTYTDHHTPEKIVSDSPLVTAVAAGQVHSLFIKSDGSVWGMGDNLYWQLGLGDTLAMTNLPTEIYTTNVFPLPATAISAGAFNSLFLTSDGALWGMGQNLYGALSTVDNAEYPQEIMSQYGGIATLSGVVTKEAAGGYFTLMIMPDSSLWGMGDDGAGQLGVVQNTSGLNPGITAPVQIVASNVVAAAGGLDHTLFIKSDGSLWGMGYNASGQLGTGDYTERDTPVEIVAPPPQISIIPYGANVILAWPTNAAAFVLQSTTNLASPAWSTVSPGPVMVGNQFEVFNPVSGPQLYYRLLLSQ